ncbi:hypothetical protein VTN77DRAFT_1485 [Rasamsonia byssochlamydoides]|uniref:uncharacterized protein n=1 Tax=Rasamsonia byssochlamydoides TaxID=89139 RepID=UPI003742BE25
MSMIIFTDIIPLRHRPKWYGAVQAAWALGTILGPLIGGLLPHLALDLLHQFPVLRIWACDYPVGCPPPYGTDVLQGQIAPGGLDRRSDVHRRHDQLPDGNFLGRHPVPLGELPDTGADDSGSRRGSCISVMGALRCSRAVPSSQPVPQSVLGDDLPLLHCTGDPGERALVEQTHNYPIRLI